MWAAAQSQPEMVKFLIRAGAKVDARSNVREWARRVTAEPRPLASLHVERLGMRRPVNAIDGHDVTWGADGQVWLPPYAALWAVDRG